MSLSTATNTPLDEQQQQQQQQQRTNPTRTCAGTKAQHPTPFLRHDVTPPRTPVQKRNPSMTDEIQRQNHPPLSTTTDKMTCSLTRKKSRPTNNTKKKNTQKYTDRRTQTQRIPRRPTFLCASKPALTRMMSGSNATSLGRMSLRYTSRQRCRDTPGVSSSSGSGMPTSRTRV